MKKIWVILILCFGFLLPTQSGLANSNIWTVPELKSFDFSPKEIELASDNTLLSVSVTVSHPIGISSEKIRLHMKKGTNFDVAYDLFRSEKPVNFSLTEVKFEGVIKLPNNLSNGVWNLSTEPVEAFPPSGSSLRPLSGEFTPNNFRDLVDAENSLLIRLNGFLDFDFTTFVGPTFKADSTISDNKPRTLPAKTPIWRVGEIFNPKSYFELRTKSVGLNIESKTPTVCKEENSTLKLIAEGNCYYRVFTNKSKDFLGKEISLGSTILAGRVKPQLSLPKISIQNSIGLPKVILGTGVYYQGYPLPPTNRTPSICIAGQDKITVYSGGICRIEYFVEESNSNFASDIYVQTFEITQDSQTISFTPPTSANLSAKTLALSATASSGGLITYQTASIGICSITGSTLNLLKSGNCSITATQAGSATLAPISATSTVMITGSLAPVNKTITCVMGKKSKKVSGANPKCPKGYKLKK